MDDQAAKDYCHSAWYKAGCPPCVEVDDLIQEYLLATLEGNDPAETVARYLSDNVRQSLVTENGQKMGFVLAGERDELESDEEVDDYNQLEREIREEFHQLRSLSLQEAIDKLEKTHPEYAKAMRLIVSLPAGTQLTPEIAKMLGDAGQARHLRTHGIEQLFKIVHPKKVPLELFGLVDEVPDLTKWYGKNVKLLPSPSMAFMDDIGTADTDVPSRGRRVVRSRMGL